MTSHPRPGFVILQRGILFALGTFSVFVLGCKNRSYNEKTTGKEFQPVTESGKSGEPIQGFVLNRVAAKLPHVKYEAVRKSFNEEFVEYPEFDPTTKTIYEADYVEVTFPSLSVEDCNAMKSLYGNYSSIRCQNGGDYKFEDFLPPAIQATNRKRFVPEYRKSSKTPGMVDISTLQNNCWATAYEIARRARDAFDVFQIPPKEAKRLLQLGSHSQSIFGGDGKAEGSDGAKLNAFLSSDKAQFGDVILISNSIENAVDGLTKGELYHAATLIDNAGLIYEKTGSTEQFAMRFAQVADLLKSYPTAGYVYEVRRMNKWFPRAGELVKDWTLIESLEGETTTATFRCAHIPFVTSEDGRSQLPPDAFKPLYDSSLMSPGCK